MDYVEFSKKRRAQATSILKKTDLLSKLERFGKVRQIGSYSTNLMIKPDIDFAVQVKDKSEINKTIKSIEQLFCKIPKVSLKKIVDRTPLGLDGKSIHFLYHSSAIWGIDVLVTTKDFRKYDDLQKLININITPKKREIILRLKYHFFKKGEKIKNIPYNIYISVLKNKVHNLKELKEYCNNN